MTRYLVRLPAFIDADTPQAAVQGMVDQIVEKGLRSWIYRVDEMTDDGFVSVGMFDGHGNSNDDTNTSDTSTTIDDDASDEELLNYADSLNGEGAHE